MSDERLSRAERAGEDTAPEAYGELMRRVDAARYELAWSEGDFEPPGETPLTP
jgi:hypothetical protein